MANGQNKKLVSVQNLNFKYNNDYILNDINLDIFKGKNVAILGRNGGGKSTLVKIMPLKKFQSNRKEKSHQHNK